MKKPVAERRFTTEQVSTQLSTVFDSTLAVDWRLAESCVEIAPAPVFAINLDGASAVAIDLTNGQRFLMVVQELGVGDAE